jgi:uncharacterized protein YxjI
MKNIQFPVSLSFKISTLSNDFVAQDAEQATIAYVKQKMFKLTEEVEVFSNESRSELIYKIKANKWLDFSAAYTFFNAQGQDMGKIARKGWASIWKAEYDIIAPGAQQSEFKVQEENAWVKVADAMLSDIPVLGLFTGYFFNPAYIVTDSSGRSVARLKKEASFWGRKFSIDTMADFTPEQEQRLVLGLMMMILLERRRG